MVASAEDHALKILQPMRALSAIAGTVRV